MVHDDERGTVSAIGLCVLTAVLLLAFAAAQFMRGGAGVASEYEREMQLRLAAESGVETAAASLEANADVYGAPPAKGEHREVSVGTVPMTENITLRIFIENPPDTAPVGAINVVAAAVDVGEPRIPDGEDWMRAKIVRARMEKKGDRYVWRRWF